MIIATLLVAGLCALAYGGWFCKRPQSLAGTVVKTASVAGLAFVAFLANGPGLLIAALGLSALGDLFLSRNGGRNFLAGMAAFFMAHIAYILMMLGLDPVRVPAHFNLSATVALLAFAGVIYRILWPGLGNFRLPVAIYSLATAALGITAFALPPGGPAHLVFVGAMAFIVSDTILAIEKFRLGHESHWRRITPYAIWAFYWLAQGTILFGGVLA